MSESNRDRAIRWMEDNWNHRREAVIDELMHPQCVGRMEGLEVTCRDDFRKARAELLTLMPELRVTVEQSVAEGDVVVLRWRATTGINGIEAVGSTWMKFADGQMVWGYDTWNQAALMTSLAAPA